MSCLEGEARDYGFDLLDDCEVYVLKDGRQVTLSIVRKRVLNREGDPERIVRWAIREEGRTVYVYPEDDRDRARRILKAIYAGRIDYRASERAMTERQMVLLEAGIFCGMSG